MGKPGIIFAAGILIIAVFQNGMSQ